MIKYTRHVVIENEARWPAQVWEHDGDEPIAIFQHAADAHLFNAATELADVLRAVADFWAGGDAPQELTDRINAALAKAVKS